MDAAPLLWPRGAFTAYSRQDHHQAIPVHRSGHQEIEGNLDGVHVYTNWLRGTKADVYTIG